MDALIKSSDGRLALDIDQISAAMRSFPDSLLITDCKGNIAMGNQVLADFMRCEIQELCSKNIYDHLKPSAVGETFRKQDQRVIESGLPIVSEEVWDFGYEKRMVHVARSPIVGADGECVGIMSIFRNLSPDMQAQEYYKHTQQRFLTLAQTCPVGIFECNPYHQISYVNSEWMRITGVPHVESEGSDWRRFIAPEHQDRIAKLIDQLASRSEKQTVHSVDCLVRAKKDCWVELSLNSVVHPDGATVSFIGSMVDLTDRLDAQRELQGQANLLQDLTSAVPAIIWQMDLKGKCIFVSDHWEVQTGTNPQVAIEKGWEQFIHPDDYLSVKRDIQMLLTNERQSSKCEARMADANGEWRWTLSSAQQIHSIEGDLIGIAGHTIDITERRQAELQLKEQSSTLARMVDERTDQLSKVNADLRAEIETRRNTEEMLEQKRAQVAHVARVSLVGQMSGELAHELNQPLNAIQNYVGSLSFLTSTIPNPDPVQKILENLNREIARAAKIIKRTRDFVSTGKHRSENVNLAEVVSDSVAMLKGEARRRGMKIEMRNDSPDFPFQGDTILLQQVIVNLVLNALESMVDCPWSTKIVTVQLHFAEGKMRIAVCDSGSGVEESQRNKLFEAFFTTKTSGLGMGLAISRSIIEGHQGTLTYEPNGERGSRFVIELPQLGNRKV